MSQIVKFDSFVRDLREQGLYGDVTFALRGRDGTARTWKGAYVICDGGYDLVTVLCDLVVC